MQRARFFGRLKRTQVICGAALAVVSSLVGASAVWADSLYFDPGLSASTPGSGGNGNWDTTTTNLDWFDSATHSLSDVSWNNTGQVSGTIDDAFFDGTAGTVNVDGVVTTNSLTFNVGGYVVSGSSAITLSGPGLAATGIAAGTINANFAATSAPVTISAAIAGTAGITKIGTGSVTLTGGTANTFTGAVNINAGSLTITPGSLNGQAVNLNGGTLNVQGTATAGLTAGKIFGNNFDQASVNPANAYAGTSYSPIKTGTVEAEDGTPNNNSANNLTGWNDNSTWVYSGQIYIATANSMLTFAKNFDDSASVKVDGTTIFSNGQYNVTTTARTAALSVGWHNIEVRLGEGTGGVGPVAQNGYTGLGLGIDQFGRDAGGTNGTPADYVTIRNGNMQTSGATTDTLQLQTFAAATISDSLNVTASSTLTTQSPSVTSTSSLTLTPGITLTYSGGSFRYATTNLSAGTTTLATSAVAANDFLQDFAPGQIVAPSGTILAKSGPGALVMDNTASANSQITFNVSGGTLVAISSSTAANSPLGGTTGAGASAVTLSGGSLLLSSTAGTAVFDNPITVTASGSITARQIGVNGTYVSGGGATGVNGAAGFFTGLQNNTVQSLTATLGSDTNGLIINSTFTATLNSADGYTLNVAGAVADAGTLAVNGGTVTVPSVISGAGVVSVSGGALTPTNANTYTGGTKVTGGTLNVATISDAGDSNIGDSSAPANNPVTLSGGNFNYTGPTASTSRDFFTAGGGNATVTVAAAGTVLTLANGDTITAGGNSQLTINKAGPGTLILSGSGDDSYLNLNVTAGTAILAKASATGVHGAENVSGVSAGATVQLAGSGTGQIFQGANYGIQNMNGTFDMNGQSIGDGSTVNTGIDLLSGTGTLTNNNQTAGSPSSLTLGVANGSSTFIGVVTDGSVNSVGLVKLGTGTFTLSSNVTPTPNPFSGGTVIKAGTVAIAPAIPTSSGTLLGTGLVTLGGGTLSLASMANKGLNVQFVQDSANPLSANYNSLTALNTYFAGATIAVNNYTPAGGKTNFDFSNTAYSNSTSAPPFGVNGSTSANYGFSSIANFDTRFSGYIYLATAGTYSFQTTSDDGSVVFLNNADAPVVNNNAFQGATTKTGTFNVTTPGLYPITIGYYQGTGGEGLLAQYTPPGGSLTTIPNSILYQANSLIGTQSYTNAVNVTASSTLSVSNSLIASVGSLSIGASTLSIVSPDATTTPYSVTFAGGTLSGNATLSVANSTGGGTGAVIFSNAIAGGSNTVTKTGAGALIVNGVNTYTGLTTISAGTVGGKGTFAGPLTLLGSASLAPSVTSSTPPGAPLTITGPLVFTDNTSTLGITLVSAGTPGVAYDQVSFGNTVAIAGATLVLNDSQLAANGVSPNTPFWILDGTSGSSQVGGQLTYGGVLLANGAIFTSTASNITYQINYNATGDPATTSNDVELTTVTPEPTSLALLALGGAGLLARRRRRTDL